MMRRCAVKLLATTAGVMVLFVGGLWLFDEMDKMVFHLRHPLTGELLTVITRSGPGTDFNYVLRGNRSRFNPLPGTLYLYTRGEMTVGYRGKQ